ncbi:mis18-binding protein 1 [Symphorus nematophorus]
MASYHHILKQNKPRYESPAKVFAKLKSRVQREEMCANDPLCSVRERHGAEFMSPRRRTEGSWMNEGLKDNHRFGSYRNEAQALTLSPISSPQKTFGYSYSDFSSRSVQDMSPVTEAGHGCTPRKGAFLESTAVCQPLFMVNRKQIHTEPAHIRDMNGFTVPSRTPVKTQPVESECVRSVVDEECVTPASVYSPMRNRLRKRKLEPWGFNNVSSSTKEVCSEVLSQPQERKSSSAFSEEHTHHNNTCVGDLGHVRGLPADRSDEPMFPPPRSIAKKRACVFTDKVPPMSPAKMFAYMKERERKTEQQEVHNISSSTRELFDGGNFHQSRDTSPPSTTHSEADMEDVAFRSAPKSVLPVDGSRAESADSHSDTDPCEDVLIPAAPSQRVLLEDSLIFDTPRVSVPKKNEAVFKRNKWPQSTKFPSDSVIYLKKWFLRRSREGLFVEGIHQEENIAWNSNIIMDRVSNYVLKTVSGRVYILVGKMNLDIDCGFPKWLLKKFVSGFPPEWKALYEKFMSESRGKPSREKKRNSEDGDIRAKTKSEASSINLSVKQHRQQPFKTPNFCPPASSSSGKVSRSGRTIKPPLEYWRGGRVILDAHMNVTIHECYDTSICNSDVSTTVSERTSQKPARVFLPCSEGRKQCESASDQEISVPLRKVKAPLRKRNRAKVTPAEKPSYSPEPHVETLSSPEESPTVNDKTSPVQSSSEEFSTRRKKQTKRLLRKRGENSQLSRPSPSSQSKDSGKKMNKRTRVTKNREAAQPQTKPKQNKPRQDTKTSQHAKPLPKPTQSSKKHKADKGNTLIPEEQDEDDWTEEELMKLQEAVSFYPKQMAGYWAKVARIVGTRSAEQCHKQHASLGTSQTPAKRAKQPKKKKVAATKDPVTDHPVISSRVGTLKRKQQVRQFLENMPRENVDDVFSSAYMQNKRFEIPSMCPSDDHNLSDLEPQTPMSTRFPEVKTPQCLHITPGMMGSPNGNDDDKYVFQLQKRMKQSQFNVCKQAPSSKSFTPTPSVKRTMRRCGNTENDTFVVWEMFPGKDGALSESGEEEDFYFSDND